jgi:subtilisin
MFWRRTLLAVAVLAAQLLVGSFAGDAPERPVAAAARDTGTKNHAHGKAKHDSRRDKTKKGKKRGKDKQAEPSSAGTEAGPRGVTKEAVIVVLDPAANAQAVARTAGVVPDHVYRHVFNGFAAEVPAQALEGLRRNPRVTLISPDEEYALAADEPQEIPAGIDRIDADENSVANIDGGGPPLEVDVAVFDTGIAPHPDLRIGGGFSCVKKETDPLRDVNGHGTHVAGTVAALDNNIGVVGVAPGARLWSVKVANDRGQIALSDLLCGLDWTADESATIDVANLSLGGHAKPKDVTCDSTPLHLAICNVIGRGVTVVAAAMNAGKDASGFAPATYEEVITVSAFADYDGEPGGGAEPPFRDGVQCVRFNEHLPGVDDDTFAFFSNFGPDVDIAAPGVCVLSTIPGDGYAWNTGTSMATPHVAGAAALYKAEHPTASPAEVRAWLLSEGSVPQDSPLGITGDPDDHHEPVLHVGPRG